MTSPVDIEVTNKILSSVAEEMGIVLQKSAFSPNIKERRDFSCAVFDSKGRLLAQAVHIPVHLGAMPMTVRELLKRFVLNPGDIIITNDPFSGGTHLPDITLMSGVFPQGKSAPMFYLLARAHHADIGGVTPGSMPLARSIEEEGVLIPPSYLAKKGRINREFVDGFMSMVRNREEREGDLKAQMASLERGSQRLAEVLQREGEARINARLDPLLDYGERVMRAVISRLPDGVYEFADAMDDDGIGNSPVEIRVRLEKRDDGVIVDFTGSSPQVTTGINTVRSVTCSAVYYCFFCLAGEGYPINAGLLRPIQVVTRPGTLLDALPPSPVAAGNVETSQRIVDCLLGALAKAIPDVIPAAGCGSMNNLAAGGTRPEGGQFTYYETIGGGMGGGPGCPGLSAVQVHMTNTLNTPIEALEQEYPLIVERYAIRRGSGGKGKFSGGDGISRAYRFLSRAKITLLSDRRRIAPYGLNGGKPGKPGRNILYRADRGVPEDLPGKIHIDIQPGDVLEIRTPGGGGWGE